MPRRSILTERQRASLLDLPTDEATILHHYTLADDDLDHINERRRPENRISFALQLCTLRYPGRFLSSAEVIPEQVIRFIGAQRGLTGDEGVFLSHHCLLVPCPEQQSTNTLWQIAVMMLLIE